LAILLRLLCSLLLFLLLLLLLLLLSYTKKASCVLAIDEATREEN
jgi:hypothetical protein